MKKVNNLLLGIMFLSSLFNGEECADDIAPDIEIEKGEIEISENINLSFDEAKSNESELELKNVKVTSCQNSSVWALTAENAQLLDKDLTIQNTKLRIFDVPIFWLGEVKLNEDESFNIPNLGVTDSNLDISYKFKTKTENSQFVLEPIYSKSSFGLSLDFAYDDGNNNFNFQSLALDDENSSWVYDIDSVLNFNEFISLTLDYSDLSGNSLIQNYGYRYLDINRRSLDLKQSIGLTFQKDNRNISIFSDDFINIGALRPVSHSKDYLMYERFFNINGWLLDLSSEYAKFSDNTSEDVTMPYEILDNIERVSRDIGLSKKFKFDKFDYDANFLLSRKEYDLKETSEIINSNSLATTQVFSVLEDRSLKFGFLWSSFQDESNLPILDSYPILPSPESNISLSPWVGKDRGTNSRKIFVLKSWETSSLNFSISTNLYEKYNFENESMIFKKFYDKKPIFFSINTKNKNFNLFANGNYSYEKSDFMAQMVGMKYTDTKTYFSFQKNNLIPSSYPLQPLDNYVLKFKRDFDNFQVFSRAQYSKKEKTLNENILGIQWQYDCLRLRLSMERARFFPFVDPDYAEMSYYDLIYLTNPKVKNNLSFEFELVGLTNILTPIDNIINNGLFN
jgi:hypothetical protein|tara:strand:- start:2121 stop:3989 length:1869 start_codon:yes stop_codon:yes gene_type:complete